MCGILGSNIVVTILVNTFNERPEWLRESIESYLSQGVAVQILVSTLPDDPNIDLLLGYKEVELHLCDPAGHPGKSPAGSYYQIHSALPLVRGDWFCFFSSNDYARPYRLATELNECEKKGKKVCYAAFNEVDNSGKVLRLKQFPPVYDFKRHLSGNFVADVALTHRSLIDKYTPFDSVNLGNYSYWDFWLRVFEGEGDVFCYHPHPTWCYRQNDEAMHALRRKDPADQRYGRECYARMLDKNRRREKR
jgi:hypothetical protein